MSRWQLLVVAIEALQQAIKGTISLAQLRQCWPDIQRHLRDGPRKRKRRSLANLKTIIGLINA